MTYTVTLSQLRKADGFRDLAKIRRPLEVRFWEKVAQTDDADSCWEWVGSRDKNGYGRFGVGSPIRTRFAHRVSYEIHYGAIADGLYVCHACDNPSCVRPAHLFAGAPIVNTRDMITKGRQRHPGRKGVLAPKAKLSDDAVREARRRFALDSSYGQSSALARDFGISPAAMSALLLRRSWSHVED